MLSINDVNGHAWGISLQEEFAASRGRLSILLHTSGAGMALYLH